MKNLPAIKAQARMTQDDLKKGEAERKQEQDTLKQAAKQLKTLKVGSAEYARQHQAEG